MTTPMNPETPGWQDLARIIDHTNLRPEATPEQVMKLCQEGREFGFAAVVVNPCYVASAVSHLQGSAVRVVTVAGFPLGTNLTRVKCLEAEEALRQGAREIDMVLHIGALKAGNRDAVLSDVHSVAEVTHAHGGLLKVILETGLLTDDEKRSACEISVEAAADFVKTSTGFLGRGATVADVALMRRIVGDAIGVKASGGIRTAAEARAMVAAGASRLGTSSGVSIIRELRGS